MDRHRRRAIINKLNQKHKLDFKYSKTKIEFLDVLVYTDIKTNRSPKLFTRTPEILKRICSTNSKFEAHINTIKDQFVKHGYEKTLIGNQIEKVTKLDESVLLEEQNKSKKASCFPLSVTYNSTLSNIKNIL